MLLLWHESVEAGTINPTCHAKLSKLVALASPTLPTWRDTMPSTPTHTSTEAPLKEITVVVFSKDRAFQLHECIRSLRQHARVVETCALRVRICVVWTASSPSCENAFRKVLRRLLAPALSKVHRPRDRTRVDARGGPGACRAATGTDTGTDTTGTDTTGTDTDTGASMKSSAGTGADAGADVGADAGADAGVGAGAGVGVGAGVCLSA